MSHRRLTGLLTALTSTLVSRCDALNVILSMATVYLVFPTNKLSYTIQKLLASTFFCGESGILVLIGRSFLLIGRSFFMYSQFPSPFCDR